MEVQVPSGKIIMSRSLKMGEGSYMSMPLESFSLAAGEERTLELKAPSEEDRTRAQQLYDGLHPASKK